MNSYKTQSGPRPVTGKQVAFIARLLTERQLPEASDRPAWTTPMLEDSSAVVTTRDASNLIDWLLGLARKDVGGQNIEPGVYVADDGSIVKVQKNKAKTRQYALVWVDIRGARLNLNSDRVHGEWQYERGLITHLTPDHRMTLEQAKAFTLLFGQCARCGRHLKAAESVEQGIGPVCRKVFSAARKSVA